MRPWLNKKFIWIRGDPLAHLDFTKEVTFNRVWKAGWELQNTK